MSGTVRYDLYILIHLTEKCPWDIYYYYPQFTDKETDAESSLPKVTRLVRRETRGFNPNLLLRISAFTLTCAFRQY